MSNYSHGVMTAGVASRKRKQRDGLVDVAKASTTAAAAGAQAEPISDNRLLAGYLAHEFLTKGTFFGEKWDPALASDSARAPPPGSRKNRQLQAEPRAKARAYTDMAHLLMTDGAHIPGIVNPTQLGRWIQM